LKPTFGSSTEFSSGKSPLLITTVWISLTINEWRGFGP
jgi:hypothetical protein